MNSRPPGQPHHFLHRLCLTVLQTALLILVWLAADACGRWLGVRVPAGVLGLALVSLLLFAGILKPAHIQFGAEFLIAEMLLFFTPVVVAAMTYAGLFAAEGLRLLAAVVLGTLIVMTGTVWLVDRVYRWESGRTGAADE